MTRPLYGAPRERRDTAPPAALRAEQGAADVDFLRFAERLGQVRFSQVFAFSFLVGEDERVRPRATVRTAVVDVDTLPRIEAPIVADDGQLKPPLVLPLQRARAGDEQLRIGRLPENDLVLEDALISRVHAYLRIRGEMVWIWDAGSSNGTFVDGARLQPEKYELLVPGARVRLGALELLFLAAPDCWAWLRARVR